MNRSLRKSLTLVQKLYRRLNEKAGLISGFSDLEMHQWMLADKVRLEAYEKAIARAVRPGSVVVDVGAGTGLLSMMACRAGAARVYAIEETRIIELARTIIKDNGFDNRIVLLRGNSSKIELPEMADVIVSETIGSFVFSENTVATIEDARRRFLKPSGAIIPGRITIYMAPIESFEEGTGFWEKPVAGFDLSAAAPLAQIGQVDAARKIGKRHFLGQEKVLYDLDFKTASASMDFTRVLTFSAARGGVLHGFTGYWEADLYDGVPLGCAPGEPPVSWPPLLFRLRQGIPVRAGDRITLHFAREDRPGWLWSWSAEVTAGQPGA